MNMIRLKKYLGHYSPGYREELEMVTKYCATPTVSSVSGPKAHTPCTGLLRAVECHFSMITFSLWRLFILLYPLFQPQAFQFLKYITFPPTNSPP